MFDNGYSILDKSQADWERARFATLHAEQSQAEDLEHVEVRHNARL